MKVVYKVRNNYGTELFNSTDVLIAEAYAAACSSGATVTHTPTKAEIRELIELGFTEQFVKERAMATAGIYSNVFFGFKSVGIENRISREIVKKINAVYEEMNG
jgi:hypothetical protein